MSDDAAPKPSERKREPECKSVVVRSRPKVIFLYPVMLAALLAGIWSWLAMSGGVPLDEISLTPGRIFWWVFAINLLALAFDFTRGEFVALVLFFGVATLSIVLLDERFGLVRPVQEFLSHVELRAHPHLYLMIAGVMGLVFVGVTIQTRFDYWEITHNEIVHHKGFLGDLKRYPAPNLRLHKEIPDLFEFGLFALLGGAGRIVIHPQGTDRAVVLDNVIGVNRIEERIKRMLSSLQVSFDAGGSSDHAHE